MSVTRILGSNALLKTFCKFVFSQLRIVISLFLGTIPSLEVLPNSFFKKNMQEMHFGLYVLQVIELFQMQPG